MKQEDNKIGLIVTLIAISSVVCGALLCLAVSILTEIIGGDYTPSLYFFAYVSGSVGFLLSAPVNLILPILRKHQGDTGKSIVSWTVTTIVLFLLACLIGIIFMFALKWLSGVSDPHDMTIQFIDGAFLLFISAGINWIFNRRKQKRPA